MIKPGIPNCSQGWGRGDQQTTRRRGVCEPALEPRGDWEGLSTKCRGFKPDLRNSAVRHYREASGNVTLVEMGPHLATERAGLVTLHLTDGAPDFYPSGTLGLTRRGLETGLRFG